MYRANDFYKLSWLTDMSQIRKVDNLLYFKGKLESNYI